jgi:hypothetical protein
MHLANSETTCLQIHRERKKRCSHVCLYKFFCSGLVLLGGFFWSYDLLLLVVLWSSLVAEECCLLRELLMALCGDDESNLCAGGRWICVSVGTSAEFWNR